MPKDPMWIPKPPVLYGSDKLEIFQPYDPGTPANTTPPDSPSCPGSPSDSSSSGSITVPSLLTSTRGIPVSTSTGAAITESTSNSISDKNSTTASRNKTPLQTLLKTLFGDKKDSSDASSATAPTTKKNPVFSQVSAAMADPIVQQYGQKSKVKKIEEENDFDRPYDPEDEYDPAIGFGMTASQNIEKNERDNPALAGSVDDDVAYDPEDETIFEEMQSDTGGPKALVPTQTSISPTLPTPLQVTTTTATPVQPPAPAAVMATLPTGAVVVSAATLTEQQRMLEELNKQIEEQKRQLKEQEEALRQQREAVGMFMAHFSVSDSLMSPPAKSLPPGQPSSQQSGKMQTEAKSESTGKTSNPTETVGKSNVDSQSVKQENKTPITTVNKKDTDTVAEQDKTLENLEDSDKYSSAGEIEDSDVAYDPEDESLFNEIQDDVFQGSSTKTHDTSGHSSSRKGANSNSYHSRKRRQSPKKRSHRERDHRSPSRRSQRRSPSHSRRRRERDRQRRSERDRSKHRARSQSERHGRHHKEHSIRRHSRGHKRSPSSPRKKDSASLSPKLHRKPSPPVVEKSKHTEVPCNASDSVGQFVEDNTSSSMSVTIKNDSDGQPSKCNLAESPDFSADSHELPHNADLENSEQPNSHGLQNNSVSDSSTHVEKPSVQETLLKIKIESSVPLREIDPPIRDSPQSPDPEPQFLKPNKIEEEDSVNTTEIRGPETHTSASVSLAEVENSFLSSSSLAKVSNVQRPVVGSPLPLRGVRDQCMIALNKQLGREGVLPKLTIDSDMQSSVPEIYPAIKHPKNEAPNMNEPGHIGQKAGLRETGKIFPGPDQRCPDMQGRSPNIWGSGLQIQDPRTGMQIPETNVRGPTMKGPLSDISSPNISGLLDPSSAMFHPRGPQIQDRATDERLHTGGLISAMLGGCMRDPSPDIRSPGSSCLEGRVLKTDTPCPFLTDERQGPQRGQDVLIGGPKSNINYESSGSNISCIGRNNSGPGGHFKEERTDIRAERNMHGLDTRQSDMMHETRKQDMTGRSYMGPGQGMDCMVSPDLRGDRIESHVRSSNRDIGAGPMQTGPRTPAEMQGRIPGPGLERRNDQMGQDDKCPMPNMTNPELTGPGPGGVRSDIRGHTAPRSDWDGSATEIRNDWRGPDRRGSVRGRPFTQDYPRVHSDRRGPGIESHRPDREPVGLDFMTPAPEGRGLGMEVPVQNRRGDPDFGKPDFEMRDSNMDNLGTGTRGPRVDWRNQALEGPVTDYMGPGGTDFMGPGGQDVRGPERRGPDSIGPGPGRRGPRNQDVRGQGPERRGPDMVGPGPDRRGPGNQDVWGPGPERRGPVGPDFRGPGPENRNVSLTGPGPGRTRPDGPNFRGSGPERRSLSMGSPGLDSRGPGCPDFSGTGPEGRGPVMETVGHHRDRPRGPEFSGPESERRGPFMDSQLSNRRESGGPDFQGQGPEMRGPGGPNQRGPGCERRGPSMDCKRPDRRGQEDQNASGLGPDSRGTHMQGSGPTFIGAGPERTGPYMKGQDPCGQGHGEPCFRGPRPDGGHPNMEEPGIERRRPGVPNMRNVEGPNFRRPGPERRPSHMVGTDDNRNFPGGPQFRVPEPEKRHPDIKESEFDRRGPNFPTMGTELQGKGPRGPDFRAPGCEFKGPDAKSSGPDTRESGGSGFRETEPEWRRPNMEGPGPDWRGSCDPDFGEQNVPNADGRRHDRRNDWGGGDFRGSEPIQENPSREHQGPHRTEQSLRGPRPMRRNFRGPRPDGSGPHPKFWDDRIKGIDTQEMWSDERGPNMDSGVGEGGGSGDNWERHVNSAPPPIQEGLDEQGQEHSRHDPHSEWRRTRGRGASTLRQERRNMLFSRPDQSQGDDWSGPGCRGPGPTPDDPDMMYQGPMEGPGNEWRESGRGGARPNRRGMGTFFRGERGSHVRGRGHDGRNPGFRRPNFEGGPDMNNEWKQSDFRGDMTGPNLEGPGGHGGRPGMMNSCPNRRGFEMEGPNRIGPGGPDFRHPGPGNRSSNIEGPGTDERFSDCGGQGFEHDFRRERRGPDMRGPGPDRGSHVRHWPGRWDTNTEVPGSDIRGHQPQGPGPNIVRNSSPDFDNPQNQQTVKPHRHRAALLPTPTEGLIRFPNHKMNNPDLNHTQKQMGFSPDREWSRGRRMTSLAVKRSTSVDSRTRAGMGNETDKREF